MLCNFYWEELGIDDRQDSIYLKPYPFNISQKLIIKISDLILRSWFSQEIEKTYPWFKIQGWSLDIFR